MSSAWNNLPAELRQLSQWVTVGQNRVPLNPRTGHEARVNDPSTWVSFEEVIKSGYSNIGFVLSKSDPYAIIDLDNKVDNPATEEQLQRHYKILETFNSYTERSVSGRGYHIIIKGTIPHGVNRDKVEVYSDSRYMICTGDVIRQAPITDYQGLLDVMFKEMEVPRIELEELEETISDRDIVDMAMRAKDADKFNDLCIGKWEAMGYQSQSEADHALLSILAFYTKSNQQVRRIFRMSALGRRDKAERNDKYIDYSLEKIRGNEPPPIDFDIKAKIETPRINGQIYQPVTVPTPQQPQSPANIPLPPGLIGEMATYFYQSAIRPVQEVALAAALGLGAGVAGRSYNISNTGLNQYIILVAKTGSGKEGAAQGIDNLIAATQQGIPPVNDFIGPSAFASGQALIKVLDERPCFVSVLGEFGLTLQQLCDKNAYGALIVLRKVLLDIYGKSGWNGRIRSSVYADVEKNTKEIQAPSVTLLGESTPSTFFNAIDASHIELGLIPRFLVIEYTGPRPPQNENAQFPPSVDLVRRFSDLVTIGLTTRQNQTFLPVAIQKEAFDLMKDYNTEVDRLINHANEDAELEIWNRSHLKALKLGGLIAVGVNPHQPIITQDVADWAINLARKDSTLMVSKFKTGEVGQGDSKRRSDILRIIKSFYETDSNTLKKYRVNENMIKDGIIPYKFLLQRTANMVSFKDHKLGASTVLKDTLKQLSDSGCLREISEQQMYKRYGQLSKAWVKGSEWDE